MPSALPPSLNRLIEALQTLPGIGRKTAARLAFFLLRNDRNLRERLGKAILEVTDGLQRCKRCANFAEGELCAICADDNRDRSVLCVVEDALDLLAIEKTGAYRGKYLVLGGALSPLEGIGPEDLRLAELVDLVKTQPIQEVIIASNPTLEGEATAALVQRRLVPFPELRITRLARGIPVGGDVEFADEITLARSLENRVGF